MAAIISYRLAKDIDRAFIHAQVAADTDQVYAHGLAGTPIGAIICQQGDTPTMACTIVSLDDTNVTVKCSEAGFVYIEVISQGPHHEWAG